MSKKYVGVTVLIVSLGLLGAGPVAALTGEERCVLDKQNAAKERAMCVAREQFKEAKGVAFDLAKCETNFATAIGRTDTKAAQRGAVCRFVDTGDETVRDLDTLREWQQTTDDDGVRDKDTTYAWCVDVAPADFFCDNGTGPPDGPAFTEFLPGLNNACRDDETVVCVGAADCAGVGGPCGFAGYRDWRLPEVDRDGGVAELEPILLEPFPFCGTNPCIDQTLFGPVNASSFYLSSTSKASFPSSVWGVDFDGGSVGFANKFDDFPVRAVRGGLD